MKFDRNRICGVFAAALLSAGLIAGCGNTGSGAASQASASTAQESEAQESTAQESAATEAEEAAAGEENSSEETVGMANPWTESDQQGVFEATGFYMEAPEGSEKVAYSYMADGNMAQLTYSDGHNQWVYRIQPADGLTDISGMYYDWTLDDEGTVAGLEAEYLGWSDATEDTEYIDDVNGVQVCNWYDPGTGTVYSLSAAGKDLNGIDFQVYAEQMYAASQNSDAQ